MQSSQCNLSGADVNALRQDPRNRFCSFSHDKEREPWDMREVLPLLQRVHEEHVKFAGETPGASESDTRSHLESYEPRLAQFAQDHPKIASMLLGSKIIKDERVFPLLIFMVRKHIQMQDGELTEEETQRQFMTRAIPELLEPEPEPSIVEVNEPDID